MTGRTRIITAGAFVVVASTALYLADRPWADKDDAVGARTPLALPRRQAGREMPQVPPFAPNQPGAATARLPDPAEPPPTATAYPWLATYDSTQAIRNRILAPPGMRRVRTQPGSFGRWLHWLPLKPGNPAVRLFDGREKSNQSAHVAVIDLDVAPRDLQQCADSIIRLRAEYLYAHRRRDEIGFHFTSGDLAEFSRWSRGYRPSVRGRDVTWRRTAAAGGSHADLARYLTSVFMYAGTLSLARELREADIRNVAIGDVFIRGGSPGHAVIVVDVAADATGARRAFILAQGFMPAQEMHILRDPASPDVSAWFEASPDAALVTPEYTFAPGSLKRF